MDLQFFISVFVSECVCMNWISFEKATKPLTFVATYDKWTVIEN